MARTGLAIWEGRRWGFPPSILAVIIVTIFFYIMDTMSSDMFLFEWRKENLTYSAFEYFQIFCMLKVSNVGLCLAAMPGAGLYAQDYESGAVYMRIQRLGMGKYAGLRIIQTMIPAFVSGGVALPLMFPLFAFIFKIPLFLPVAVNEYSTGLLAGGHVALWFVDLGILAGFRAVFYALLTLLVSLFIPRKKVLIAVPYILCYFLEHVVSEITWLPGWMNPGRLFELQIGAMNTEFLNLKKLPEWCFLGIVSGIMLVLCVAIWFLFYRRLSRSGVFGGEQSE